MTDDSNIPNFKVESFIEQQNGEPRLRFFWKRKRALSITLEGPEADQLAGYSQIANDLAKVSKWAKIANEQFSEDIQLDNVGSKSYFNLDNRETADTVKALFIAALTFYGKSFTKASGRKVKLDKKSLDVSFHKTHDFFMDYRHNFAAHSGDLLLEKKVTTLVLIGKRKTGFTPILHTGNLQPDNAMIVDGEHGLDELAAHAISVAYAKYDKLSDHIKKTHILPRGEAFWEKYAKSGKSYSLAAKR